MRLGGWYQGTGLTSEGRIHYREFLEKVIRSERQSLSSLGGVLAGYNFNFQGVSYLKDLENGGLVLSNYTNQGPLRGLWHSLAISVAVRDVSGREVRWVQSRGSNRLVAPVHMAIAESLGGIVVKVPGQWGGGTRVIKETLSQNEVVGLYPEGRPGRYLGPATRGAGRIIQMAAEAKYPIIIASCWPDKWDLNIIFQSLSPEEVLGAKNGNPNAAGEYVMLAILSKLPATVK